MIRLFRHDGLEFMLNVDQIGEIRPGPLTVITLLSGEELKVKNSLTDVLNKVRAYRHGIEGENREYDPDENRSGRPRRPQAPRSSPPGPVTPAGAGPVPAPEEPQ
ncbi:MAG: flagellar FlbD family protein [Acidobacteria bacterium]|jgi:uncharacterized protein YlzI (FlbEa/FlbD family)|nr:flagellar FlbD family protein [Acidobacteriota bacterium]